MGRSSTTKYAVEMTGCTSACWRTKETGAANLANLTKYVEAYIASLQPGGCNAHISASLGYMPIPNCARLVLNDGSRKVIAEWKAPKFMVIEKPCCCPSVACPEHGLPPGSASGGY